MVVADVGVDARMTIMTKLATEVVDRSEKTGSREDRNSEEEEGGEDEPNKNSRISPLRMGWARNK